MLERVIRKTGTGANFAVLAKLRACPPFAPFTATRPPTITNPQKNLFPNPINNLHPKLPPLTQEITYPMF